MKREYKKVKHPNGLSNVQVIVLSIFLIVIIFFLSMFLYANVLNVQKKSNISNMTFEQGQMKEDIYLDLSKIGNKVPVGLLKKSVNDINLEIRGYYNWNIKIKDANPNLTDHSVYDLDDVLEPALKEYVKSIYSERSEEETGGLLNVFNSKSIKYTFDPFAENSDFKINLNTKIEAIISKINTKPHTGEIVDFDKDKNEFIFTENGASAFTVDKEKLIQNILNDCAKGKFDNIYDAVGTLSKTDGPSIQSKYKILKKYETRTTKNEVRNENIRLACEVLNGYIVKPNEEFSFNKVIGERTEEKGYGYAPAYLGGLVVNEIGGGVCQVSTTLYNTVFGAGLSTTSRHSHTYAPQYISPGLDATVSWPAIDYTFVNDSPYAIGIKASYENRNCKVEIFGVPKLNAGEEVFLVSKQIETYPIALPIIIDSGNEVEGTEGSRWDVFKVTRIDGKETDRIHCYYVDYDGYQPKILRSNLKKTQWESIVAREEEEGKVPGKGSLSIDQSEKEGE